MNASNAQVLYGEKKIKKFHYALHWINVLVMMLLMSVQNIKRK
jgi:hypothetical protein